MSSPFNLEASLARAAQRFGQPPSNKRKNRSDQGKFRLGGEVADLLRGLLQGVDFPGVKMVLADLTQLCQQRGLVCPSRATIYKFMQRDAGQTYRVSVLPQAVRAALYNLTGSSSVPGAQLAFYCFNYGDLIAVQYAAGMSWWPLYQAARMRGWRPKSRGLLLAVLRARGISRV